MGISLKKQAEKAALKNQLIKDKISAKHGEQYLQYLNKNVAIDRGRRRGWTIPDAPERDMKTTDRKSAMAQARQKVEENPLIAGLIQTEIDNTISSGYRLSMRTTDDDFNQRVEAMWELEKDTLDIRGVRNWGALQRMWDTRKLIDGDVGIHFVPNDKKDDDGRVKTWIQTIESERIYKEPALAYDSGVDFDDYGRPVKYYVGPRQKVDDPKSKLAKPEPIEAKRFKLYANYLGERAERERGVSSFLQILNHIEDIEEILEAMLQKVKKEAFIGLKFKVNGSPDGNIWGPTIQRTGQIEDGTTRKIVKMVPGLNLNLGTDEDAEVMESKSPNAEFVTFIRLMIRMTGLPFGMPLEMILLDPSETNYSGLRSLLEFAKKRFRVRQNDAGCLASSIFQYWLSRQVKYNGLIVPPEIKDSYWTHRWGKPGWPYLDPVKEVSAFETALKLGITTRDTILGETSDQDVEDIAKQLKKEEELFDGVKGVVLGNGPDATLAPIDGQAVDIDGLNSEIVVKQANAYGVSVRAGVITPQPEDEDLFREKLQLPKKNKNVEAAWSEEDGVRRPITLKYKSDSQPAPTAITEEDS